MNMQKEIKEAFRTDEWRRAGTNESGVCLYELLKDGEVIARGSMLSLYDKATDSTEQVDLFI